MADFYEILGISQGATPAEVRQAYVRLAKERHPDRFPDPVEKNKAQSFFQDLTTAFNTLFNERSRREYDEERERKKPVNPVEMAQVAYDRALAIIEDGGSPDEALTFFRAAVHHQPNEARYHAAVGRFLAKRTTFTREAIQSFERAIQLSPKTAGFHADLALLLLKQGMKLRAQKAAEQALRLSPRDPQVQKIVALVNQG
ncbi:MAG TPA: DnaJ domain-containing protein [Vicinamibacteria bacterium]|nr:DnaJ domain-containing protein [Vicinamibacteria bacterium]